MMQADFQTPSTHEIFFLQALALAIISAKGKAGKPVGHELAVARQHGNQRRLEAWHASVRGGYEAKRQLVSLGKGHNTLSGIPA